MTRERIDLGFGDNFGRELDKFNPEDWPVTSPNAKNGESSAKTREVAEAVGFRSRERPASEPPRRDRRRRTGRNLQLNIKVTQDTMDAFYAIADAQGWGLGETLEHAVELLDARYGRHGNR